jgi:hypothetical protein
MVIPLRHPHPVIRSGQVMRPLAILPGAPAWDAAPLEFAVAGFDYATLYFTYIWDVNSVAPFGAVDIQFQGSPYAANLVGLQNWFPQSLYAAGLLAAGADTQSRIQREYVTYQATAAGLGVAETFSRGPIHIVGTERLRVVARESGDLALPGVLEVVALLTARD